MSSQLLKGRIPANCFPFRWEYTPPFTQTRLRAVWGHCWHARSSPWFIRPEVELLYVHSWHLTRTAVDSKHIIYQMLLFKGEGRWHIDLDPLTFIIFVWWIFTLFCFVLPLSFKSPSKNFPNFVTQINMSSDAAEGKGQINYDNKHLENLSSGTLWDVIKDCFQ